MPRSILVPLIEFMLLLLFCSLSNAFGIFTIVGFCCCFLVGLCVLGGGSSPKYPRKIKSCLLCFAMFLLCFAMFCYAFAMFFYVLLCFPPTFFFPNKPPSPCALKVPELMVFFTPWHQKPNEWKQLKNIAKNRKNIAKNNKNK